MKCLEAAGVFWEHLFKISRPLQVVEVASCSHLWSVPLDLNHPRSHLLQTNLVLPPAGALVSLGDTDPLSPSTSMRVKPLHMLCLGDLDVKLPRKTTVTPTGLKKAPPFLIPTTYSSPRSKSAATPSDLPTQSPQSKPSTKIIAHHSIIVFSPLSPLLWSH